MGGFLSSRVFFIQKLAKLHFAEILIFVASFNNAIETKKTSGIHKCLFNYALVIVTFEYVTVHSLDHRKFKILVELLGSLIWFLNYNKYHFNRV